MTAQPLDADVERARQSEALLWQVAKILATKVRFWRNYSAYATGLVIALLCLLARAELR